jgi:NADP-dependent 3-hydroxy acid dehydrogenase YdfG
MAASVSGKIAFVTGGASGIGAALAAKLVDAGAEVWIADRQIGPAQELAQRLNSGGANAHAIELDVRDYSPFERAVAEAVQQSGRIDYLFNNASIGVAGEIDSYTLDDPVPGLRGALVSQPSWMVGCRRFRSRSCSLK